MKKIVYTGIATLAFAGMSAPAFASNAGGNGYGEQPGYDNASTCGQAHGAFGVFGPGNNMAGGADGQATGLANRTACH